MAESLASVRRSRAASSAAAPKQSASAPIAVAHETVANADNWPAPPSDDVFHGLAGELVTLVEPHTEADSVGLLLQFLVGFGNVISRSAHFAAESDRHFGNLFMILVGNTSKGRKGSAWRHVLRLLRMVDERWATNGIGGGLSSGEGLIWQVRDPIEEQQTIKEKGRVVSYDMVTTDPGVSDKRSDAICDPNDRRRLRRSHAETTV